MKFYQYKKVAEYKYTITEKERLYNKGVLSFPSVCTSGYSRNDTVYVDTFEPPGNNNPAVILIHSWHERRGGITEWFAKKLAKEGFSAYLIHLPYHINRTPEGYNSGTLFLTNDVEHSILAFRQAVIDTRCLIDWITEKRKIPEESTGILGISLGAIIMHTVIGVDRRVKVGASLFGGGNINYIFTRSCITLPYVIYQIKNGLRIRDYRKVSKDYIQYLKEVKKTSDIEEVPCPWKWFLIDPLTYAHLNQPRKVLMINGRFDLIIPHRASLQLWEALGRPEIIWLPSTHLTARFFQNTILYHTLRHLKSHLLHTKQVSSE